MAVNTMAESTSGAIGQDADGVAALASAFRIASNRVSGLADRLSTWRAVSGWSGPDASSFEASMRSTFASMRQAAGSLASAHTALVRNASEQRQTSAPEALLGVDAAAATVLAAFSTGTANWLAGLTDRPPNWMPVSRSQVVFDVQASGEILASGGQLRLEVVEYLDGRATVSARAEPELLAQLGLGNAAYVGGGGQIVAGATYSFDNADDAHAFVDALPDGLWPEASEAPPREQLTSPSNRDRRRESPAGLAGWWGCRRLSGGSERADSAQAPPATPGEYSRWLRSRSLPRCRHRWRGRPGRQVACADRPRRCFGPCDRCRARGYAGRLGGAWDCPAGPHARC